LTRFETLVEAGIALTSELSLDALLRRLLELAADLTGARYAALGVVAPDGTRLERFLSHGLEHATEEAIGDRPQGRGILGVLLHEAHPLRLDDLTRDPRAAGFPPNHPPMRSFLGVPIVLRGAVFGNLYLTEKAGAEAFTAEDEGLVTLLAAQAAVAIENARLYEAATRWSARLESLNEVGNALATETDLGALLDLVARRLRELLEARCVAVLLPAGRGELRFAAVAGEGGDLLGTTFATAGSKSGRVLDEQRSERVDSVVDDPEVEPRITRRIGARTGLWVPLLAQRRSIGVLVAHDKLTRPDCRFADDDVRLAETFATRAAVAVDLSERIARDLLRRAVTTQETERRRLARELHEETAQELSSILLGLRGLEKIDDPAEVREAIAALRESVAATLKDVRRLAVELHPKTLEDFGLVAALERMLATWQARTGIAVDLDDGLGDGGLEAEVATALYRIVQEALENVVKHARARRVRIVLSRTGGEVVARIEDDGRGFDAEHAVIGPGLRTMRERAALVGGRFRVESAPGRGTAIVIEAPAG
jgi:signal transduction histidine kinase